MAIQNRRGAWQNFDPSKMVEGEWAVVQSGDPNSERGRSVYMAFQNGQVERMATYEDMEYNIDQATADIQDTLTQNVGAAVTSANNAASAATTAATGANTAAQAASDAVDDAQTAIAATTAATTAANTAATAATTAATAAQSAVDDITAALSDVDEALESVSEATTAATTAATAAQAATTAATTAATAATTAAEDAESVVQDVSDALGEVTDALDAVQTATTAAQTATTAANTAAGEAATATQNVTSALSDVDDALSAMQTATSAAEQATTNATAAAQTATAAGSTALSEASAASQIASDAYSLAEQAREIIDEGTGVGAFNGRTGVVVPAFGDYDASLIEYKNNVTVEGQLNSNAQAITTATVDIATLMGNFDALFKSRIYSASFTDLAAGANLSLSANDFSMATPSGYEPVAAISAIANTGSGHCLISRFNARASGAGAAMLIKNTHPSTAYSGTAQIRVLYAKSAFVDVT